MFAADDVVSYIYSNCVLANVWVSKRKENKTKRNIFLLINTNINDACFWHEFDLWLTIFQNIPVLRRADICF